jgi:UDP-N-acetylglucosamine--N-acetylmuramyl-(pentapeptide) pyrophosphoryl-undecaprenol N-acetylglucosamine transferase
LGSFSALLVCSGGGHLKQLSLLAPRLGIDLDRALWVTFETGLSSSLLAGREVRYATYAAPRDMRNILRNQRLARELLAQHVFEVAVSTGASLAVNFLPLAGRRGVPAHYIESAARASAPSLTGRILGLLPHVEVYTQYPAWANRRWPYVGSVFDGFLPQQHDEAACRTKIRSAVVSVGTTESYGFRRLIERAAELLRHVPRVLWQTGATPVDGLRIDAKPVVPAAELDDAIREADVVLTHAGTGIALTCLEAGKVPILVPRRRQFGEHVDDHQLQIALELASRGLALACDPEDLSTDTLLSAARMHVMQRESPPVLRLVRS